MKFRQAIKWLVIAMAVVWATGGSGDWVTGQGVSLEESLKTNRTSADHNLSSFSPSNARTVDGQLIPVEQFIPAARCAKCHQDTHAGWSDSLHRNAAREPFYRESADILLKTRGIELTRHCESCHTPVALFSGALTKDAKRQQAPFTPLDDEGITCSVCHSTTEARLDGTGSYTIRRPALLAQADGTPLYGDFTDEQILADVPGHKRAVMNATLRSPEFCATCHKVDAPPALNNYKHIRGFTAYDEWQQSGASHESVLPFYQREMRTDCRACHMPKIDSANDRAAKQGKIASHRWLGANTAAPQFYGQSQQVQQTEAFLKADVLAVDIFALRRGAGESVAALAADSVVTFSPGEEVTADVVIANRNAALSFPPEVRDLYEAWVEFEVLDNNGKRIFHSGFIQPNGLLDEAAHVYKQIILDEQGRQITRHQIWTTNIKAYDNAIPAGRSDLARFRFRVPSVATKGLRLRTRVNYRRFNQEYTSYVLSRQKREMTVPIVRMTEAEISLGSTPHSAFRIPHSQEWRRWNDYGIALLEQAQYGEAAAAFRRAAELSPADANLLINAALTELRTERFAHHEKPQLAKAAILLERAAQVVETAPCTDRTKARLKFYRAGVLRAQGDFRAAAELYAQVAAEFPRDREVQRHWAQTNYSLGNFIAARLSFENIVKIDPTDFAAYQFLSPLYSSEGRKTEAERANELYLQWREDPRADGVGSRFFAAHPEWADERIGAHIHEIRSSYRPVLTGQHAAPDK